MHNDEHDDNNNYVKLLTTNILINNNNIKMNRQRKLGIINFFNKAPYS